MKALEILYQYKQADEEFGNSYSMGERLDEAIKELEEYESDMDSYLNYTTGSRCTKSFNSSLGSIKIAYGKELEKIVKENSEDRFAELETLPPIQQTKAATSTNTNLIYCPVKNSSCILSKCAAYTTHNEPDILKCDSCDDTFYRGQRCKNYIKGKPDHIKMSLYKNRAYCKHFKRYVFI